MIPSAPALLPARDLKSREPRRRQHRLPGGRVRPTTGGAAKCRACASRTARAEERTGPGCRFACADPPIRAAVARRIPEPTRADPQARPGGQSTHRTPASAGDGAPRIARPERAQLSRPRRVLTTPGAVLAPPRGRACHPPVSMMYHRAVVIDQGRAPAMLHPSPAPRASARGRIPAPGSTRGAASPTSARITPRPAASR